MLRFKFRAKTIDAKSRKGIVEAQNKESAAEVLRGQQLVIIEIREIGTGNDTMFSFMNKVKYGDVVNFTRQLSTMIAAGLPLTNALSILQMQASPALQRVIVEILKSVEGGSTLGDAMKMHEQVFSKVYIALIKAGESAGILDTILSRLADNLEKQREFRAKTKGALIYPVIVLIGMMVVMFIMMVFVLPKLTVMYKDFDVKLPWMTQVLIDTSDFASRFWYVVIMVFIGIGYVYTAFRKTKAGKLQLDKIQLKLPIFGKIKMMTQMAEFSRTLGLLAAAGVALVDSLKIVRNVVDNEVYGIALDLVAHDVEKGNALAIALARHEGFPMIISQMVSVGEQTGKLDDILERLSVFFESESEHAIKNLSTAMEPIIMLLLGLGVGFLVIAIIVPIYNLTSAF